MENVFHCVSYHVSDQKDKPWIIQPQDEVRYKNFRRTFRRIASQAETEYFKSRPKFGSKVNPVKKLWKNLNSVCSASGKISKKSAYFYRSSCVIVVHW